MLLVLESYNPFFNIENETIVEEDGNKTRTNYVDLIVEVGFALYAKSGELIDRVMASEAMFYQKRPALSSIIVIGPSMGKAGEEVNALSGTIGQSYIQGFYPTHEMTMRMIYTGRAFRPIAPYLKMHMWDEAIEMLLPLAESPDPKIAMRAANNLAVAYDGLDDQEAYIYWMKRKTGQITD